MKNITKFLPYTAGYIDGDGCFYIGITIQKPKMITVYEYSIQVLSVKKPVLDKFCSEFGGYIRKKPDKPRHRTAHCWIIKGQTAAKLAAQIYPFLVDKKEQCEMFIEYSDSIYGNNFKTVERSRIKRRKELIKLIREERNMNNLVTEEFVRDLKNRIHTITPIEDDYPYLAGLIDAEGCFQARKWKPKNRPNDVYAISLQIGNTRIPILPWLMERFGGNASFSPAKGNRKASVIWTIEAAALYKILPKIRPFLINKQEVCDKLIEFQKTILPNGGDRHSELFRALFEKRREVRERIIKEIHKLNSKGK